MVVTPYYNKATQKGLKEHFKLIGEAVSIPIILYNIPGRTGGVNLLPETIVSLCEEVPSIVGVKDATDNFIQYAKLMALAKGKVDVYSGNDNQIVPFLSLGAKGVISVLSNIAPQQTHDICAAYPVICLGSSKVVILWENGVVNGVPDEWQEGVLDVSDFRF